MARRSGEAWGEVSINLATEVARRDICLAEVDAWIASERKARTGAPAT